MRAPGLKILVTSRRRLDLPGEKAVSLAPLALPEDESVEPLSQTASVRLFLDRAQSVRLDEAPGFQVAGVEAALETDLQDRSR